MDDFATYILEEKDLAQKMVIVYYLSKNEGIYFDKAIVLKTTIAKLFIEYMNLDIDENLVLTAMLLCNCKKVENAQKMGKLETYAKEGSEYLASLGFDKRFCKICEEVNRYTKSIPREKESDILELVDQFTGLILRRIERDGYTPTDALIVLRERNLKFQENKYLDQFEEFVKELENIYIKDTIEVAVIKKLVHLHDKEANVRTFITVLANIYFEKIEEAFSKASKEKAREIVEKEKLENNDMQAKIDEVVAIDKKIQESSSRALFSEDTVQKVLAHKSKYKLDESDDEDEEEV